jgi:hypothetical protein
MSKHSDVVNALNSLYSYGRSDGRGRPKSAHGAYKAHDITPACEPPDPRQQEVQNPEDRPASHGDVARNWLRGYGKPHPHFSHSPPRDKLRR